MVAGRLFIVAWGIFIVVVFGIFVEDGKSLVVAYGIFSFWYVGSLLWPMGSLLWHVGSFSCDVGIFVAVYGIIVAACEIF